MIQVLMQMLWGGFKGLFWTLVLVIAVGGTLTVLASLLGV